MLPFMKRKNLATLILAQRGKSDVEIKPEMKSPGDEIDPGLIEAAEDILRAINEKSPIVLAHALHAAFQICDAMPHEEGEHLEESEEE